MSTAKMGVDILQGEGDWKDYLSLTLALPTAGASLMLNEDWRKRVGDNYMFSELLVEDLGMDPDSWVTRGLGFAGDVAADPLMYIPGAGAAARTAQGGRWLKAAKAADDMAIGYAMTGDIAKANMMKAGAARMARNRSIISGGKEVLDELGYKAGASLLLPGTGRLGRQLVEKPLNLLTGGKLTRALAKQRAKQIPRYMFDTPTWKVAENQTEIVEAMNLLRRGSKATKAQLEAIPAQVKQAARFANSMQIEIPGAIRAFAAPLGIMAAGPGRLWGATMRRTGLQNLNLGGQARPLRALSRSLNDDNVIFGMRALDARDVAKIRKNNLSRSFARTARITREAVELFNADRVAKGLPEIGPEELMYLSDTPREAVDENLHKLHDTLTQFWKDRLDLYNESIGHRGAVDPLKDELYAARFLDLETEAGRKVKNLQSEDVAGSWEYRGMSGDDPTRKRRWVVGEDYMGVRLDDPEVVGKSVREQMLDIGRSKLGADYQDMFVKDFWTVVARYDKAMADKFFHQNWFNEMEKAGLIQAGTMTGRGAGYANLTRDAVDKLDNFLKELAEQRAIKTGNYERAKNAVDRAVNAVQAQQTRITNSEKTIIKLNSRLDDVYGEISRLEQLVKEFPEFATLTASGRTRLLSFIRQFTGDEAAMGTMGLLEMDEVALAVQAMEPIIEEIATLRKAQDQLRRILDDPLERHRAGGITREGSEFADFVDDKLRVAETMVRSVAADLVAQAHESVDVKALEQLAAISGDAVSQGMALNALPPGFVPPVDLLSNQPVKAYIDDWAVDTQGFMQEADVIAYNEATGEALIRTPANAEIVGLKPNAPYLVSKQGDKFGHFKKPTTDSEFTGDWLPEGEIPYSFDVKQAKTSWRVLKEEVQEEARQLAQERFEYWDNLTQGELTLPKPREWRYHPGFGKRLENVDVEEWDWWFEDGFNNSPFGQAIARMWLPRKYETAATVNIKTDKAAAAGEGASDWIKAQLGLDSVEQTDAVIGEYHSPLEWMLKTATIERLGLEAVAAGQGHRISRHGFGDDARHYAASVIAERLNRDVDAVAAVFRGFDGADPEDIITVDRAVRSAIHLGEQEEAEMLRAANSLLSVSEVGSFHFPERFQNGTLFPTSADAQFTAWRNRLFHEGEQTFEAPATPMSPEQLEGVAPVIWPPRAGEPEKLIDILPRAADEAARREIVDAGGIPSTVRIPRPSLLSSLETELTFLDDINQNENLRAAIHAVFRDGIDPDFIDTDPVTLDEVYGFITMLRTKERRLEGRLGLGPKEENVNFVAFLEPPDAGGWRTGGNQSQRESEDLLQWARDSDLAEEEYRKARWDGAPKPDKGPPPKSATDIPQNLTIDDLAFPNLSDAEAVVLKALWRAHDPDGSILTDEIFRLSGGHIEAFDESSTVAAVRAVEQSKIGSTGESVYGKLEGAAQGYFDFDNYFKSVLFPQAIGSIEEAERMLKPAFMQTQDLPVAVLSQQGRPYNVWDILHGLEGQSDEFVNHLPHQLWMGEDLLALMYQLEGASPHVVQEYFAVINSAARDIRSFERRTAAVEASYEQLISTGEKALPSGRTLGEGSGLWGRGALPVPPKPLAQMNEVEWDAYKTELFEAADENIGETVTVGRSKKKLHPQWASDDQRRVAIRKSVLNRPAASTKRGVIIPGESTETVIDVIERQLAQRLGNDEIAADIVAALKGEPYEGWGGTIARSRTEDEFHMGGLMQDRDVWYEDFPGPTQGGGSEFGNAAFGYTDTYTFMFPFRLRDLLIERGLLDPADAERLTSGRAQDELLARQTRRGSAGYDVEDMATAAERGSNPESAQYLIMDHIFGEINVPVVTRSNPKGTYLTAEDLFGGSVGGQVSETSNRIDSMQAYPATIRSHLDDVEAVITEREGSRAAKQQVLEMEKEIHDAYPVNTEMAASVDQQIADQVWLELPDVEFDTAAVARITGASQSRQYWRDAGYDFVDEPRVSGKGFPWGPPGPGSWRGPGKGPWPTAVQEPVMMKLGHDVDVPAMRSKIAGEIAEGPSDGLFANPQGRTFAENMVLVEALDEVINAHVILREAAHEVGVEARIARIKEWRAEMQPVIAALNREIRMGEASKELVVKGKQQHQVIKSRIPSGADPKGGVDYGKYPFGTPERPLMDVKQEALAGVEAQILAKFDDAVDRLERLLHEQNVKLQVLQGAEGDKWSAAAELMQFQNAAELIETNLRHDLELIAQSPNVLDQVSAAASQEDAIRAVMNNRVMMSSFGDAYGTALSAFAKSYRKVARSISPGGRGGGGGHTPYIAGGMDDEGWNLFEEAVIASAGLADPKKMNKAMDAYLKVANWWKAQAVFSPGFVMRNLMGGAMVNSLIAGVEMGTHSRIGGMARKAQTIGDGDVVLGARLLANEGKSVRLGNMFGFNRTATADDWEVFAQLLESGVVGQGQAWSEVTSAVLDNRMPLERTAGFFGRFGFLEGLRQEGFRTASGWNPFSADFRPFTAVRTQNERAEFVLRGALGFDIMKKGGSPQDAMNAINKYHFDYQDLTRLERSVKAVVPFYTWQKNIIPVLVESLGKKPQAWTGFLRAKVALELGQERDGVVPDYYGEMMGIGLPFKDTDIPFWNPGLEMFGGRVYAVPDTPFRQLFQLTKEPTSAARTVTGSIYPWLKTPAEIWAKKQFFADIPFSGRYQQVPSSYEAIPGLMSSLKMFGKAEKNTRGEWKMRDHDIYLVEQLSPIFGRHRRLFGNEEAKRRRAVTTWVSFLFGGGFRVNDYSERRNQIIKDQVEHSNDMRDRRDIEGRRI